MKNAALSQDQLAQLIEVAQSQVNVCTDALASAHKKYMNPSNEDEFKRAEQDMGMWGDRQWAAMGELGELQKELERRVLA